MTLHWDAWILQHNNTKNLTDKILSELSDKQKNTPNWMIPFIGSSRIGKINLERMGKDVPQGRDIEPLDLLMNNYTISYFNIFVHGISCL